MKVKRTERKIITKEQFYFILGILVPSIIAYWLFHGILRFLAIGISLIFVITLILRGKKNNCPGGKMFIFVCGYWFLQKSLSVLFGPAVIFYSSRSKFNWVCMLVGAVLFIIASVRDIIGIQENITYAKDLTKKANSIKHDE